MGSQPRQIWELLLGQGFLVALLGLLSGLCGILLLAHLTSRLDYAAGSPSLLPAFLVSVALNLIIWMIATSLPARRASKLDPMKVLK
jgi:ABC-type lipoprotein release transport system permease subunit